MIDAVNLRQMTSEQFSAWGAQDIAYVAKVVSEGAVIYAIHAADGTRLALAPSRDIAIAAVKQHELEPVSVH
jgi:hypothetical protein